MTNLIGISGRLQSGKDTVGKIIQTLTTEHIKNGTRNFREVFPYLNDEGVSYIGEPKYNSGWEIKKYAKKLKQICSILTGIPEYDFEKQEVKDELLGEEWNRFGLETSVRELLQRVGTEAMREGVHQNVWVNALFADYKPHKMSEHNPSKWIITDVRFNNEAEAIESRGGLLIRVNRGTPDKNAHISETALDNYTFDYVLENNGSLEELTEKVKEFITKFNIK